MKSAAGFSGLMTVACVAFGALCSVLAFGLQSPERILYRQQRESFVSLSEDARHAVRLSAADFDAQTSERQAALRALAEAAQSEPELRNGLQRYAEWWSSLSQSEWDAFQEMTTDEQLAFARSGLAGGRSQPHPIRIEFPGPPGTRLPALSLSFEDFGKIISEALSEDRKPDSLIRELDELTSESHKTLRLLLWMFESQRDPETMSKRSSRFQEALLAHCPDAKWKSTFSRTYSEMAERRYAQGWLVMIQITILGESTTALGRDLQQQFTVTDDQILEAFEAIEDKAVQQQLMTLPAAESRIRLSYLAQANGDRSPEERLLGRYIRFDEERDRLFRFMTLGFGGQGGFGPDRNERNGGRRGDRRDPPPPPQGEGPPRGDRPGFPNL